MASLRETDVFVIGGGPAGLSAAIAARKTGLNVTVADGSAPPIEKPCGEGMMPEALTALHSLGVQFEPQEGKPFRGISFIQEDGHVSADFPNGQGLGVRRPLLHERLIIEAEKCGVCFLWRTPVIGLESTTIQLSYGTIRSRWIVGADGQGSRVRQWTGLGRRSSFKPHAKQRYASRRHFRLKPWSNYMEIHWGSRSQAYVTPVGSEEICVAVTAETTQDAAFDVALTAMPSLQEKLAGAQLSSRERGAVTVMRSLRRVYKNNVALLGDASGGVDAITGEGLRLAFRQAFALAEALVANDLAQYQQAHQTLLRGPMLMGHLMLWLGRNPLVRERTLRVMQSHPHLFARILAAHAGPGTPAELLSTSAQLGLRVLAVSARMAT